MDLLVLYDILAGVRDHRQLKYREAVEENNIEYVEYKII